MLLTSQHAVMLNLAKIVNPDKIQHSTIDFVDIAGLVRGASKGEGLGNQFLSNIREVEVILHMVRCFEDGNIVHVEGDVNPLRDIEIIETELIYADISQLEKQSNQTWNVFEHRFCCRQVCCLCQCHRCKRY